MHDNTQSNNFEPYVDSNAVMEFLSVPRRTLELLVKQGLPHIRINRSRRYRLSEIQAWLDAKQEERK
jgi:predicted DNA-binding transcriptional regulator AlpA